MYWSSTIRKHVYKYYTSIIIVHKVIKHCIEKIHFYTTSRSCYFAYSTATDTYSSVTLTFYTMSLFTPKFWCLRQLHHNSSGKFCYFFKLASSLLSEHLVYLYTTLLIDTYAFPFENLLTNVDVLCMSSPTYAYF